MEIRETPEPCAFPPTSEAKEGEEVERVRLTDCTCDGNCHVTHCTGTVPFNATKAPARPQSSKEKKKERRGLQP